MENIHLFMHYLLFSDRDLYPSIVLKTQIDDFNWVSGEALDFPVPPLAFHVEGIDPFQWCDYLMPAADIPLFSPLLRQAIEEAGAHNVDYYPATVTHPRTRQKQTYWAANVLGLARGMDRKKSVYTKFRGDAGIASDIEKLVLDERALKDLDICRLSEYDLLIVISEAVKSAIQAAGVTGVIVAEPEEWDGFAT